MRNGFVRASAEIVSTGSAASATSPPAHLVAAVCPDLTQSDFLEFLKGQSACLKCPAETFHGWLQSEDINNIDELVEAMEDDDFVRTDMQRNGLKVRFQPRISFLQVFWIG